MTLKEELEIIRGEPIEVRTVKPEDVPCIETSDAEKLCKRPLVSVQMITYNHEPYIRQAIEGVLMQQTNFDYELIIGEDCSQDQTREICLEYQKKYPDKIRVLWWHENVSLLGGNSRRCKARCRGEFIALCEGDDYWTDPLKLQKQVDVMRAHHNVNLVFGKTSTYFQSKGVEKSGLSRFKEGVIPGHDFVLSGIVASTLTMMVRKSALIAAEDKYEIFNWRLYLGDKVVWIAMSLLGDVYYLDQLLGVYRVHSGGVTSRGDGRVKRDGGVVSAYFSRCSSIFPSGYLTSAIMQIYKYRIAGVASRRSFSERRQLLRKLYDEIRYDTNIRNAVFRPCVVLSALAGNRLHNFYCRVESAVLKAIATAI